MSQLKWFWINVLTALTRRGLLRWLWIQAARRSMMARRWLWQIDVLAAGRQSRVPGLHFWDWTMERTALQVANVVTETIRRAPRPQDVSAFTLKVVDGATMNDLGVLNSEWCAATPQQVSEFLMGFEVVARPKGIRLVLYGELAVAAARRNHWVFAGKR
jgi:hypothetical protein